MSVYLFNWHLNDSHALQFDLTNMQISQGNTVNQEIPTCSIRVALIREDLVALTGDYRAAVVLNQLIYWDQLSRSFQNLLEKERQTNLNYCSLRDQGWIITSAPELCELTMMGLSRQTMRCILKNLIKAGWLQESMLEKRKEHKIAKYRLDILKIQNDLQSVRDQLNIIDFNPHKIVSNNNEPSSEKTILHSLPSPNQNPVLDQRIKIDNENHTQEMLQTFSDIVLGGQQLKMLPTRAEKLKRVLKEQLSGNMENWRKVCQNVTRSKFLMGESKLSNFKATLDWLLEGYNTTKVFECSYGVGDREADRNIQSVSPNNEIKEIEALEEPQAMKELRLWILERFGVFDYIAWFKLASFVDFKEQNFTIMANGSFVKEQISCRFAHQIREFLEEKYNQRIIFEICLKSKEQLSITSSTNN